MPISFRWIGITERKLYSEIEIIGKSQTARVFLFNVISVIKFTPIKRFKTNYSYLNFFLTYEWGKEIKFE